MNIGYFIRRNWYPPRAGSAVHIFQVASQLTARGHHLSSIFTDHCDPQVVRYQPTQLPAFLRQVDLIYIRIFAGWTTGKFSLLKLLKGGACPVVWELNAPLEEQLLVGKSRRQVAWMHYQRRLVAGLVDACICNSQWNADYAARHWGIKRNVVVRLGSDPKLFDPDKRDPRLYDSLGAGFKVVWAGTARFQWHCLPLIVQVAERMRGIDPAVSFILIGGKGHLRQHQSWPENVTLLDEVPYLDLPPYLASADLGLCFYQRPGHGMVFYRSPLKVFDYMASGLPVIATEEEEMRPVVRRGHNGLLVDNDVEQIVEAILQIKENKGWRQRMGLAGREDVVRYYNWQRVAEETEAVFHSVLGQPPRATAHASPGER
jgi:glycosyltransferase involved in cell wall biosynthesis